jgi:hypothetical protein
LRLLIETESNTHRTGHGLTLRVGGYTLKFTNWGTAALVVPAVRWANPGRAHQIANRLAYLQP